MISSIKQTINQSVPSSNAYKEAHYYNYYRKLDQQVRINEDCYRRRICLIPTKQPNKIQQPNDFKLETFDIVSDIVDTSIISLWTQSYINQSNTPVEAKYQLPLSPLSVVSKFSIEYKDKVLIGKIKEKSKAKEQYNDAIASGGQAFIGEKDDATGLFNFMIGNLPPNEKVTIKLTIVSEIGTHLSSLHYCLHRFMFPLGDYEFNYQLNCQLTTPIKSIQLDDYKSTFKYLDNAQNKKATLEFSTTNGIKKNIIAIIEPESSEKPQSFIEFNPKDKSYAIALNFYPVFDHLKAEDLNQKSEYIFVIDCSGSMSGNPIQKAKRALEYCVRSLNENNKFNIYCFGSSFNKVFSKSLLYNDESLEKASKYIDGIGAHLGGTELLPPIKDILKNESDPEYPRQVFLITDGEISSRDQLIDFVAKESNTTRMFTFGIGDSVDQELVIGLSKVCKGYFEFINNNNEMEEKVMKLLDIANEPTLANIKIDWNGLNVIQSPSIIRPIFNRERMIVYGLMNSGDDLPTSSTTTTTVQMVGDGPLGEKLKFSIDLDFQNSIDSKGLNQIHTLAAFKQIQDLEEEERKNSKDHKDKIVELGKKYGLVSKHTSVIVTVEGDGEVIEESMKTVNILKQQDDSSNGPLRPSPVPAPLSTSSSQPTGGCAGNVRYSEMFYNKYSSPISKSSSVQSAPPPGGAPRSGMTISRGGAPPQFNSNSQMKHHYYPLQSSAPPQFNSNSPMQQYYPSLPQSSAPPPQFNSNSQMQHHYHVPPLPQSSAPPPPQFNSNSPMQHHYHVPPIPQSTAPPPPPPPSTYTISQNALAPPPPPPVYLPSNGVDALMGLLKLQKANGSFIKTSIDVHTFKMNDWKTPNEFSSSPETENIWTTFLVIAKISKNFSSQKNQWERAIQKSIKWIKNQLTTLNLLDQYEKFEKLASSVVK
ncbi:hypothetical protein ACTA71_007755 [Dictyostelium dimigraforme]